MADIDPLLELMEKLRDKDKGCPWDIKQDHNSIAHCSIEEAYELVAAITKNDQENIKEELGDVLLQVIFHSQIAKENNAFDFNDVIEVLSKKLITRHPNVFDPDFDLKISADEQSKLWDEIKALFLQFKNLKRFKKKPQRKILIGILVKTYLKKSMKN